MISALIQKGDKVLVTAPSNAAVANIALKLWTSTGGIYSFEDIVVFGENCDKTVHFLSPRHRGVKLSLLHKELEGIAGSAERDKKRREFLSWLKLNDDDDRTMADLSYLCPYINTSTIEGRNYYARLIHKSSIVFSTLNSAGSVGLRNNFPAKIILLDEGGQCPEAEYHILTTYGPTVEKVCVIGDPRQLPSTVIEPKCKIAGYGKSWLEKVHLIYPEKVHLLDTQYRMDPVILKFPNREFYQNRILSGDNVLSRDPFVEKPVVFVDTAGRGHEEISNFSWQNLYEVIVIKNLLFSDPDIVRVLREKKNARVIIITPYKAQAKLLKEHINLPRVNIEIATVDSFQGQEGDIVIIATVRTHRVGFVDDAQRLNVALTRAKRILRIVGDAAFFDSMSSQFSTLRKLSSFARRNAVLETPAVKSISWIRPNWHQSTLWKPTMTQRFQHCLNQMTERDKNICLNTLFTIAKPDETALYSRIPLKKTPSYV
jgi:AAA domain